MVVSPGWVIGKELKKATGQDKLDAIIDCAGAPEMMQTAFALLAISGNYADVGFIGDRIDVPLFPRVSGEQTFHGSFWGNNADLSEIMALAAAGKIGTPSRPSASSRSTNIWISCETTPSLGGQW